MILLVVSSFGQETNDNDTMKPIIYDIQLGLNHCYLIQEEGMIMVDAGVPKGISTWGKISRPWKIIPSR